MARSLPVASLLASLLLAGCLDPGVPGAEPPAAVAGTFVVPGGTLDEAASRLVASATGASRYTGKTAFEPTIGVAPSGAIFMSRSASTLRSLDDGSTWQELLPTVAGQRIARDNDPYVYVDPDTGRVFVNANQMGACTILYFSDDLGETWDANPAACPVGVNDHQTMVAAKPRVESASGYPNAIYICTNGLATTNCARSLDGGATFLTLPVAYAGPCDASLGHLAASPDGILYIPTSKCNVPTVLVSKDDGASWESHAVNEEVGIYGHELRVAVDEAGNVFAFWQGDDGLPYLARSSDEGATWSEARMVGFPDLAGMDFPAIAAGAPGRIAFAYVGTTFPAPYEQPGDDALAPQLARPAVIEGMEWYPFLAISVDALSDSPTIVTVRASPEGDPISRGECGRTRCDGVGDFIGIAIGPDGRPWASFADACTQACLADGATTNSHRGTGGAAGDGFAGTLGAGPALRGALAALASLPDARAGTAGHGGERARLAALPVL